MTNFREKSHTLITCLLAAYPCLSLLFRNKTVLVFRFEICRRVDIWKSFVIVELFPMENTVGLKVLLFKPCLFYFLLFSLFGLLKFLKLLSCKSSILETLSVTRPWTDIIIDVFWFLSHFFVHFGNFFSFVFSL